MTIDPKVLRRLLDEATREWWKEAYYEASDKGYDGMETLDKINAKRGAAGLALLAWQEGWNT